MDAIVFIIIVIAVIAFWPLIKAYALFILLIAVLYYLFVVRPRRHRL